MKRKMIPWVFLLILIFSTVSTIAQEESEEKGGKFDLGADLVSRYVWRGTDFGNSPAIQPWASYSNWGFTLGAWGSYSTNSNSMQEADFFLSYDIKEVVTLTVTDYFFPNGKSSGNKYFEYDFDSTSHVFEVNATFNGVKKIPVTFSFNYNFMGADKDNGLYMELGYGNTFKSIDYNVFLGGGSGSYYLYEETDNFGIVNLGLTLSKAINITDSYSIPISTSIIFNPNAQGVYFVFGISL
jgi:hypothetical protein